MLGSKPGILGLKPDDLTIEFFDYIFQNGPYSSNITVAEEKMKIMRDEFLYWYPMDLRCSGKDLIQNHLTMALFNHSAIWDKQPELWPKGYFCNGYVLVDGEKMSKSKGNFYTLEEILNLYDADSVRIACANAGDTLDDANFTLETCVQGILRLAALETWINHDVINNLNSLRSADQ